MYNPEIVHHEREGRHQEGLGLVHVYTGNGKGKTTAALGLP
jgi:ATP:corrinoid adenosyltransferase